MSDKTLTEVLAALQDSDFPRVRAALNNLATEVDQEAAGYCTALQLPATMKPAIIQAILDTVATSVVQAAAQAGREAGGTDA